jgi:CRISPR type I-E-associated protein CasB/Cse2
MTVRAAVALARRLGATGPDAPDARMRDAIDLARVVAHVKEHREDRIMHAAGWKHFAGDRKEADAEKDRPKLSEARFRRLLETGGGEERVISFVRLVRLLDHTINVRNLAEDFLALNHPRKRDRVREQWAFDYYAAGLAAPSATAIDSSNAEDAT